jgi:hypothetical protein
MKGTLALAAAMLVATAASASAQQMNPARFHVAATVGFTEYDLAAVGHANIYSARAGMRLNPVVGIEALMGYTSLETDSGDAELYFPEAQVQFRWPGWRVSPFVGAGAGVVVADSRNPWIATDTDVTFSTAGGLMVDLAGGVILISEVRVRGIGTRLSGSTGDFNLAVGYRF